MKRIALIGVCLALGVSLAWFIIAGNGSKEVDSKSWQQQYDLGVRLLGEGKYEEAIIAFQAVIQIDPKQSDAYVKLADIYLEMGDLEQAAAILEAGYRATGGTDLEARLNEVRAQIDALTQTEAQTESPTEPETEPSGPAEAPELPELLQPDREDWVTTAVYDPEDYVIFTENTANIWKPVIDAALTGDQEQILAVMAAFDSKPLEEISYFWTDGEHSSDLIGWTMWKEALLYYRHVVGAEHDSWNIEYRPKAGVGFHLQFDLQEYRVFQILIGDTYDWLFDGEYRYLEVHYHGDEVTRTIRRRGTAKQELLHGEQARWEQDAGHIASENYYMFEEGLPKPEYIDPESGALCAWKRVVYREDGTQPVYYREYDDEDYYQWIAYALGGPAFS